MRILVCPDAFKGTLSAIAVARAIAKGLSDVLPNATIDLAPMADGGTGTLEVMAASGKFERRRASVRSALGEAALTPFLTSKDLGWIVAASAIGLERVPPARRNPLSATSYGVGQLILAGKARSLARLVVAVGGTATVDGGIGMAQALGYRFLDARGRDVAIGRRRGYGGAALLRLRAIVAPPTKPAFPGGVAIAVDVRNPLCGSEGAARVYGPQKGATPSMVASLDDGLANLREVARRDLGRDGYRLRGAGAGGGLAGGVATFLGGRMVDGAVLVMATIDLAARIARADVVVTGEGRLDSQTLFGKTVKRVASLARAANKPLVVIAGSIADQSVARRLGATLAIAAASGSTPVEPELTRGAARRLRTAARVIAARL